jgi:hypothetical protein
MNKGATAKPVQGGEKKLCEKRKKEHRKPELEKNAPMSIKGYGYISMICTFITGSAAFPASI